MDIDIRFDGEMLPEDSLKLNQLGELIEKECDLEVDYEKKLNQGQKS